MRNLSDARRRSVIWRTFSHKQWNSLPLPVCFHTLPWAAAPEQSKQSLENYSTHDTTLKQPLSFSLNTQMVSNQLYKSHLWPLWGMCAHDLDIAEHSKPPKRLMTWLSKFSRNTQHRLLSIVFTRESQWCPQYLDKFQWQLHHVTFDWSH